MLIGQSDNDKIKIAIKRKDCSDFTLRFGKLKNMKVSTFIKIKNIHDDCLIAFKQDKAVYIINQFFIQLQFS